MKKDKKIPYGRQTISDEDINSVIEVLKSDYLTQGPKILEFEKNFANYIGCDYAVAVSNGTAALHLSSMALNLKKGDKVITTPITFVASANCIRYCGAEVVFSDIDPDTYLLDIKKVEYLLENSPPNTFQGIIPVDFAGRANDLESFRKLANKYDLWILEDACHSPGGYFVDELGNNQNCGNGNFADLAIFSFHPVKHIAAGEGGMITTNNEELYRRLLNLRSHGIQQNPELKKYNHGMWYYEMQELGFNYRLTDMQAALGNSQLKQAKEGIKIRRNIASKYYNFFKDKIYIKGQSGLIEGHAYHLYVIRVEQRDLLFKKLRGLNIICQVHYIPAHLMPYYQDLGNRKGDQPCAESYYSECITLPIYPSLSIKDQDYVMKTIDDFYNE